MYLLFMADVTRGETAESVILPPKRFLKDEDLVELWEVRGLKFRVDDLYAHCRDRGLLPYFRKEHFRAKVFSMLQKFLVEGETRRDPRYVPPPKPIKRA